MPDTVKQLRVASVEMVINVVTVAGGGRRTSPESGGLTMSAGFANSDCVRLLMVDV